MVSCSERCEPLPQIHMISFKTDLNSERIMEVAPQTISFPKSKYGIVAGIPFKILFLLFFEPTVKEC